MHSLVSTVYNAYAPSNVKPGKMYRGQPTEVMQDFKALGKRRGSWQVQDNVRKGRQYDHAGRTDPAQLGNLPK